MTSELDTFRQVFDACYPKLVAYARRRTSPTAAEDVVADTFLVAWRRRSEFLAMHEQLPWLYGVAGNQLRNHDRSTTRHLRLVAKAGSEPAPSAVAADAAMDAEADGDVVRQALQTLSFDDQEVLRLIAWEELSYAEAAATVGCSVDALAQRVRRAKDRLGRAITEAEIAPDAARAPHRPQPPSNQHSTDQNSANQHSANQHSTNQHSTNQHSGTSQPISEVRSQ